jgi:lysozyme family protein
VNRLAICLAFVARWEGGWSDHAADRGGKTKFGITEKAWGAYAVRHIQPGSTTAVDGIVASVRDITLEQAHQVYAEDYWAPSHACDCAPGLDLAVVDLAINSGVHRAVVYLQRALGVAADGVWGPKTAAALSGANPLAVARELCNEREALFRAIAANDPSQAVFLKGWLARVNALRSQLTPGTAP